jgi:ATP-binding cassette subfamily B protein
MLVAGLYVADLAAKFITEFVQTLTLQRTGQRIMFGHADADLQSSANLSPSFYDRNPVGRLITLSSATSMVLNELFSSGHRFRVLGCVHAGGASSLAMRLLDWRMALVTMAVLPLIGLATAIFRARARDFLPAGSNRHRQDQCIFERAHFRHMSNRSAVLP